MTTRPTITQRNYLPTAETTVITHSDGRQATAPVHFANKWSQDAVDTLVMQAHRGNVLDVATTRVCGVTAI